MARARVGRVLTVGLVAVFQGMCNSNRETRTTWARVTGLVDLAGAVALARAWVEEQEALEVV